MRLSGDPQLHCGIVPIRSYMTLAELWLVRLVSELTGNGHTIQTKIALAVNLKHRKKYYLEPVSLLLTGFDTLNDIAVLQRRVAYLESV